MKDSLWFGFVTLATDEVMIVDVLKGMYPRCWAFILTRIFASIGSAWNWRDAANSASISSGFTPWPAM